MIIINNTKFYTQQEASILLGVSYTTIRDWLKKWPDVITPIEGKDFLSAEALKELAKRCIQ